MVTSGDELRHAGPTLRVLKLELDEDSDMDDLTDALQSFTSVKHVVVSAPEATEPIWMVCRDFFVAVGSLPGLESLNLKWLGNEGESNPVPLQHLTALLRAKIRTSNHHNNIVGNGSKRKNARKKKKSKVHQCDNIADNIPRCQLISLRLTELTLSCQVTEGDEDFDDEQAIMQRFATALGEQQRLRELRMDYCDVVTNFPVLRLPEEEPDCPQWDPVFYSLAKLPNLEKVIILEDIDEPADDEDEQDPDDIDDDIDYCLSALGPLEADTISSFVTASASLQELQLQAFHLTNDALISLSEALESPQARLKKLQLDLSGKRRHGGRALAKMLGTNTSLEYFNVWVSPESGCGCESNGEEDDDGSSTENENETDAEKRMNFLEVLAKSLETNRTLISVEVQGPQNDLNAWEEAAFVHMLQTNGVIQNLKLLVEDDDCGMDGDYHERPGIAFYLRLNQRGRGRLQADFENISREEWIRVLSESSSDMDSLFYWIRMNPNLCDIYRHYCGDAMSTRGQNNDNRKKSGKKKRNRKADNNPENSSNNATELAMIAQLKVTVAKLEKESEFKSQLIETIQQEMKTMAAEKEKMRLEYDERIAVLEKNVQDTCHSRRQD